MTSMDLSLTLELFVSCIGGGLIVGITYALLFSFWR